MESVEIRRLGTSDAQMLREASHQDLFDNPLSRALSAEFLADPRHHIFAAVVSGKIVGFASAVHYVHPDKPAELWINEVSVAGHFRGQGIGRRLLQVMFEHARATLGCDEAWVLAEEDNAAARRLYASVGGTDRRVVYFTFPLGRGSA